MSNRNWQKARSRDNVFPRGRTTVSSATRRNPSHLTLSGQFLTRKLTQAPISNQTPTLLDLQLDLPDPINRVPYALVRGGSGNRSNQPGGSHSAQYNQFTNTARSTHSAKEQVTIIAHLSDHTI